MIREILLLLSACSALRLRGVHDEDERYVADSQGNWKCLRSDKTIRFDQINDDQCDCPDGSDEPGTSACSGVRVGDPRRFYCENKGHRPEYINNALVDDGVCDYDVCCDGSDEAGLAHVVKCPNKCAEIHREWQTREEARRKAIAKGLENKVKLLDLAAKARESLIQSITVLEKQVQESQAQVDRKQATKQEIERQVAENGGVKEEPEQVKAVRSLVDQMKAKTSELESYLSLVELQVDQANQVLSDLKANYNPNFNDPAVKAAVRAQEDLEASTPQKQASTLSELTSGLSKLSEALNEISLTDDRNCFRGMYQSLIQWFVDQHILSASLLPSETSTSNKNGALGQRLTKAQNEVRDSEHRLQRDKDQLNLQEADLNKDYGEGDVFRALKEVCISKDLGDYHYELCFHGKLEQTERSGHKSSLGHMTELKQVSDDLTILNYEDGAQCWNGPKRRATVEVRCGAANELLSVSEPQRCDYAFKILSPSVCKGEVQSRAHDEL